MLHHAPQAVSLRSIVEKGNERRLTQKKERTEENNMSRHYLLVARAIGILAGLLDIQHSVAARGGIGSERPFADEDIDNFPAIFAARFLSPNRPAAARPQRGITSQSRSTLATSIQYRFRLQTKLL